PGATRAEPMLPLLEVNRGTSIFDLAFTLAESTDGLMGAIEYSTDLFEAASVRRMIGHYQTLLNSVVVSPDSCLSQLRFVSEGEERQLLEEWNATRVTVPEDQ